jgi:hypothetical protein
MVYGLNPHRVQDGKISNASGTAHNAAHGMLSLTTACAKHAWKKMGSDGMFLDVNKLDKEADIRASINDDRMEIMFGDYAYMSLTRDEVDRLQYEMDAALRVAGEKGKSWQRYADGA